MGFFTGVWNADVGWRLERLERVWTVSWKASCRWGIGGSNGSSSAAVCNAALRFYFAYCLSVLSE